MKLRIKFSKLGPVKFIGHLDIMRYFQKAMRRADIDITYTEGFSPHQKMSFAAPLGVGIESYGEYFDIEANSITNCEDMKYRLNQVMAEGIRIESIRLLQDDTPNAMASVKAAGYTMLPRLDSSFSPDKMQDAINDLQNKTEYTVEKETKSGAKTINILPFLFMLKLTEDKKGVEMITDASSSGNMKPGLVMKALHDILSIDYSPDTYRIYRQDVYTYDTNVQLISFEETGEKF